MNIIVKYAYVGELSGNACYYYHADGDWNIIRNCDDIRFALRKFWSGYDHNHERRDRHTKNFKITEVSSLTDEERTLLIEDYNNEDHEYMA